MIYPSKVIWRKSHRKIATVVPQKRNQISVRVRNVQRTDASPKVLILNKDDDDQVQNLLKSQSLASLSARRGHWLIRTCTRGAHDGGRHSGIMMFHSDDARPAAPYLSKPGRAGNSGRELDVVGSRDRLNVVTSGSLVLFRRGVGSCNRD